MQARTGGPFAVGSFDREWMLAQNRSGSKFCFAGHGASLVASLAAASLLERASLACFADAQLAASLVSVGAERCGRAGDLDRAREDELGADAVDLSDRPAPFDGLEGARAPRRLAPATRPAAEEHTPL